jgi:gliding motility-associated-like protein
MKQLYRLLVSLTLLLCTTDVLQAQCDPGVPTFTVDFSASPDTTVVISSSRVDHCCGATGSQRCIRFLVTVNPGSTEFGFTVSNGNNGIYKVDCINPGQAPGTPLCLSGVTTFTVTYCNPGGNSDDYTLSASRGFTASADLILRAGSTCTGTLAVQGVTKTSINWTSIAPGALGAYNSFLSCTSGCDTTYVTPVTVAPGSPSFIDYRVCGTSIGCASGTFCDTVRVFTVPAMLANITPANPTICSSGGSVQLTATPTGGNAPYTYSWTGPGGFTSSISNPTVSVIGQYIVTIDDNTDCNPVKDTIVVTQSTTPSITSAATGNTCSGVAQNYTITSNVVGTTYSWSRAAVTGISNAAVSGQTANPITEALVNTTTAPIDVIYLITPTAAGCVGSTFTYTVTVNPRPTVTNSPTVTTCSSTNPSIALTASVASTFTWTVGTITGGITGASAGSGSTINQTLTNPSTSASGTVQYIVTPTSVTGSCVGSSFTITVTVLPKPAVTNSATYTICSATSPAIALTSTVPSNFTWTIGTITGGITGASANSGSTIGQILTNPSNVNAGAVEYIVTPTSVTGSCIGNPFTITVGVNPRPVVTNNATAEICSNTAPNTVLTASTPSNFSWTIGTNTGGITGASAGSGTTLNQTLVNPSNATQGSIQYIITPTSVTGSCIGNPYTITISVNPTPAVTNPATVSTCSGTNPSIALTASTPSTFSWNIGTITGGITGASAGTGSTINQVLTNPSNATAGTVQYIVTPTSTTGNCAGAPYTITVTVNPTPAVTNSATYFICNNTNTNIALTASAPSNFSWTLGTISGGITGATAGSGSTISQVLTNPSNSTQGSVQYIVTPTSTTGSCAGTPFTITVAVNPTPVITNATAASICNATSPNLSLTASAPSTFSWTIGTISGGITGASAGSGTILNQTLTNPGNASAGSVQYIVTPTSSTGSCAGAPVTVTITVNPTPVVTNANTLAICNNTGANLALTASAPSNFSWTIGTVTGGITGASAGTGSTINQTLTNPSNATSGTVQYIVTPTSITGNCVGAPYTITVTVNPSPAMTIASAYAICSGTAQNVTLTSTTTSTYAWTIGNITGGITGASAGSGSAITQTLTNPSTSAAGTVEYIVTPTSSAGCAGTPLTITFTVNPRPVLTTATTYSVCSGVAMNVVLTASATSNFSWTIGTITGSITGASAGSGGNIGQTLTNPGNASAGTVEYIVTPTLASGGCAGPATTLTFTVNPTPVVTTANTSSICSGAPTNIALTASAASTFTWTIGTITGGITGASAGSGSTIAQALTNPGNATAGTVQYIVVPTSSNGCTGPSYTITVTVNPTPVVTNPATTAICTGTGTGITLTSTAPSNFAWTIGTITGGITGATAGSGGTINQTLTNPSNATAGTVQYIVTPTSTTGGCAGSPFTITVTVNPRPVVTNSATASICSNTSPNLVLSASTSSTFTWTIGTVTGSITGASAGSGGTINQTLTNPSNASAGTVQYIVTPTSVAGSCPGTSTTTITITVNPVPVVTNAATLSICSNTGTNISLTATAASNFAWTIGTITGGITGASAGSGSTINQTLTNPGNSTAGSVQYIVTPTSTTGGCAGAPYTITVTVNPTPVMTIGSTYTICSGTSQSITLTSSAPSTFAWTLGTNTGGITGASAGSGGTINQVLTNPSNSTVGSIEYIISSTSTTGSCPGTPLTITFTVNPKPAVTNPATAAICNNTSPNITLTASAASSFAWTIGTITGSISGASAGTGSTINQTLTNPSNATAGTVQYIVTPTSAAGCAGNPYTITVTVNPTPAVTNAATKSICNATSTAITLTSSAPSSFAWTIGNITGGITGATAGAGGSISQTLTNPSNSTSGTVEYIVTPTSTTGGCVGAPYTITVTVNPTPAVTNAAAASICNATSPNIVLTASTPSSFAWTIGAISGGITGASAGSGTTINQTLTNPSNATAGTVEYIVTPTSTTGSCPGASSTITITVNPTPVVTNPATSTICSNAGPNIVLAATTPSTFTWTIGTVTGGITGASAASGGTINQTLVNPSNATAGSVQYIITPTSVAGNCVGAPYTITVTVNPTPALTNSATYFICNATSPNIALTATAPSSFAWTIGTISGGVTGATAGAGNTINQVLTNPSNSTQGSVQYIVTPTSTAGSCAGTPFTITVGVNPTPAVTNAPAASICHGASPNIVLTASASSSFAWTIGNITGGITGASAGSGTTINQTLSNPSNATAGTVEYIVTPTSASGGCAGAPYTITITVNPRPVVTNNATTAICNNTSPNITLTASAPSNFAWTIGTITGSITGASAGGGGSINQTLINPSNATVGTVQYIVTPTSVTGACVGTAFTITVSVNPTPAVTNPAAVSICNATGPNITLAATAPSTFAWTIGTINGGITGATAGAGGTINQTLTNPSNTTAGSVQYIVTPTSTAGGCPGTPYTITVTVNPTPVVTNPATAATCNGTSPNIALTASAPSSFTWTIGTISGGITGASAGSGTTINQTLTNPSNSSAGTVQYIVTPTSSTGSCPGAPYTITITVNPTPTVTTLSTASTCNNTSPNIALTASVPSNFAWTIGTISGGITGASAGSGSTISQVLSNPNNAVAGSVQYIVTPTSQTGNCAGAPFTITVTVNPTPAMNIAAAYSVCSGVAQSVTLTATAPSNFAWTIGAITGGITGASAGSGSSINQALTNPSNATAGTVQYIITPTSTTGGCAGAPFTATFTVNPTPAVTNPASVSVCNNTSPNIALAATAPSTFAWTIGTISGSITGASAGSGTTINQTLTNPSNSSAGSVQYIVTPTSTTGSCAGAPFTITVTVNPTPAVTNPATLSICNSTSPNINLTTTTPSNFAWTIGTITGGITGATAGGGSLINQTLTNPSNSSAGTVEYIITPTSVTGACVGAPYTITVTVNPTPAVTNPSAVSICSATSPNIALTSSAASSFTWTIGAINGGITGASPGSGNTINQVLTNPSGATAGSVEYIVTPTSGTGSCGGSPFTITVTVNPRPVITNSGTLAICNATSPNIALTSTTPSSFAWTVGTITGSITGATAGSGSTISDVLNNPSNTTAGSVEYIVTPTSTTGACVALAPYTITVTVNPTPAVTNPSTLAICNNTSTNISLTATVASNFTWTIGTITGGITGATAGAGSTINQVLTNPSNATAGSVQYIVTPTSVTGNCAPASPYTITVTVNPTPGVTNPGTATICSGTSPNINLTSTAASNFSWTIGAINGGITGATAGSGNTINQVLTNPGNATAGTVEYIVTPSSTTGSCGGAPFSIVITVNPIPAMTNSPSASICNGGNPNISLSATTPSTFSWTVGTITGSISGATAGTGATISQVLTNPSAVSSGSVEYVVTPTSNAGCVGAPFTITATVTVFPTPVMTNAPTASTCSGTGPNITLTASTPSTFVWTIGNITGGITGAVNSAGGTINQTLTNPSNATAGTVEYIVTPTSIAGGCPGAPFTITVTVNPTPAVTNAPAATMCNATSPNIALTSSAPATFAWTIGNITGGITGASAGSGTTLNQVLTNPGNATAGSVEYIVTPTSTTGLCAGAPFTITITVNPTPVVTNPAAVSICNNTSPNITLAASTPSNFAWTIGTITGSITGASAGSGGSINQTLTNPSNATAGSVQYIITPTSVAGNCVGAPYTITVTVNPTPAVTSPSTVSICNNTSPNISLTATTASNFAWTIGTITGGITGATAGAGNTINQVLTNPGNATAGTVEYVVTPTSSTGNCTPASPFTITVTVNPTPVVTNGATLSICNNTSPNLTLTSSTPSTFAWTIGTITGSITGASAGSGNILNQTLTNPSNSTAGSVEYIITPTSTTGSCVAASPYSITITVNPTPAITNPATSSICSGTSPNIILGATTASNFAWTIGTITGGITGATAGSGNNINQVLTNPSTATAGSVQYIVTPTSVTGNCTPPSPFTITVTVNPRPVVTNSATATICNATSPNIALTSTTPANFSWTIGAINGGITGASAGSGSSINQVLTNPSNSAAGSVEYLVTPTSTTGACVSLAPYSIVVTVNPTPVVTNPASVSICNATSPNITLAASAPSTFTWTIGSINGSISGASPGSGATIGQTLTNPSNATAGSVQYIVTPTSANGCVGAPYTITVTVNPTPAVTNPATLAICNAGSPNINLTASAPSNFAWTIGTISGGITGATAGSGNLINQTLTNPSNATAGSVQYIVTPTSVTGNCVGAAYTITVTVNPRPAVTNAPAVSICTGTSPNIALTASAPSNFSWTIGAINGGITGASNGSGNTINQTLTNPSNSTAGSVEYIVTPVSTTGTCTGAPFTITVTVNPRPLVTNPANVAICNNTSTNLTLTASAPSTFAWTIGSISGSITGASAGSGNVINQTLTNPSNSTPGSVQYNVTATSTTGNCVATSSYTITVTVNPTPAVTNPSSVQICNATSPNITLTASTASTFTWTIGTITGGITGATAGAGNLINQTLTNPSNSTAGSVQYIVTPTSTAGSCAAATPFTITVTVNPTPAVTNAPAAAICTGGNPNIALTASVPSNFSWTIGAIMGGVTGASAGSGLNISQVLNNPSNSVTGSVQYIVTPTSNTGNCAGAPFTITVTVHPRPVVTTPSTASTCSGTGPGITLTASTPSTFIWTVGTITGGITGASAGSGSSINQALTNPSNTSSGSVQYIVTPTSTAGTCPGTPYIITVTVYPTPVVTSAATGGICNGIPQNYLITGSVNPGTTFTWSRPAVTGISNPGVTGQNSNPITEILTNTTNAPIDVVYNIVPSANGCTGTPFTYTLTVYSTPNVTSASTGVICSSVPQNYLITSAVAGATFSWDRPAVPGISNAAVVGQTANPITESLINTTNAPVDVTYVITPSATGCSTAGPFNYTVTVNPTTFVTTPNTAAICSGTSPNIALTSSVPSTFTWTVGTVNGGITGASAGSGNNINQVLTNPSTAAAGSVQYLITPTSTGGNCTGAVYSIIVTVNPRPTVTNPTTLAICSATSPDINLTASAPSTFTWTVGTVTGGITGASAGSGNQISQVLTNPSATTAGTVEYLITPTTTVGGCTSVGTAYSIIVTVNPTPDVTNAPSAAICSGNAPNITLTASAPSTFAWTIGTITGSIGGASAGSGNIINQILTNPGNTAAGSVQYVVTPTSTTGGCVGAADTITITVNPTPLITNPATLDICNNTSPNIAIASTTASTFTWTIGTITGGITGASAGSGSTITNILTNPSNATAGSVQYIITPTSASGCVGPNDTITVTVNPTPVITTPTLAEVCNGNATSIALTSTTPSNFSWTIGTITGGITGATPGSGSSISQVLNNPSNSTAGTVAYIVTPVSTTGGCAGSPLTITVTVNPTPAVTNPDTKEICSGTSTNIALTSTAASNFSWTIGTITGGITGASAGTGTTINQVLGNPSSTTAGTVEYIVTPTSTTGSCASAPYIITVTVNPIPVITNSGTAAICNNTSPNILLTSSTPATFSWTIGTVTGGIVGGAAGSGNNINQTLLNPSNSTAGTVEYLITPTSTTGACVNLVPYTITVTVNPTPAMNTNTTDTICSDGTTNIALTATAPSTFTWTVGNIIGGITGGTAGSGSVISQTLTNPSNTTSGSIQYIVTPTSTTGGCANSSPYTITVTVNPKPAMTTPPTTSICNGGNPNIPLSASTPSTFTWTVGTVTGGITGATAGSGNVISQVLNNPSTSTSGTVEYIVTPTSANGCVGAPFSIVATVTVFPTPIITNLPTATTCSGTGPNVNLTASTPSTFAWTIGTITGGITGASAGSGNTINQTLTNPNNSTSGTVQYIVTATSIAAGCPSAPDTITVTVFPSPLVTSAASATICNNTPQNYLITSSVSGATFTWSRPLILGIANPAATGTTSPITEQLNNTTVSPINVPYTINATANGCTGPAFTYTLTVNPTPAVTSVSTGTVCSGVAQNYTITTAVSGTTLQWSRGATPGISNPPASGNTPAITEVLINTTTSPINVVYIIQPVAFGCNLTPPFAYTVTVNPTPVATAANDGPKCAGSTVNFTATSTLPGSSFSWTGPGGFTATGATPSISNVTAANNGDYFVTATLNGCNSTPVRTTVVVGNIPATADAGPNQTYCANNPVVTLTGSIGGGTTTGIWTSTGSGQFTPSNTTLPDVTYTPSPADIAAGSVTINLTTTNTGVCPTTTDAAVITFSPAPTVYAGEDATICADTTLALDGQLTGAGGGVWSTSGTGSFSPNTTSLGITYTPSAADRAAGVIQLYLTSTGNGNCNAVVDTVELTIVPLPVVNLGPDVVILEGATLQLNPTVSGNNLTYLWTPNANMNNNTIRNPIVTGNADMLLTLTVTGTNNCVASDQMLISVLRPFKVPNTFTPNGDGINDTWVIDKLNTYPDCRVQVFNRYGQVVFESYGYPQPWNGTMAGKPVPFGTYYYIIEPGSGRKPLTGYVTVLK